MEKKELAELHRLLGKYANNLRARIQYAEAERHKDPERVRGEIANLRSIGRVTSEIQKTLGVS